jgi:hypothetical protein
MPSSSFPGDTREWLPMRTGWVPYELMERACIAHFEGGLPWREAWALAQREDAVWAPTYVPGQGR